MDSTHPLLVNAFWVKNKTNIELSRNNLQSFLDTLINFLGASLKTKKQTSTNVKPIVRFSRFLCLYNNFFLFFCFWIVNNKVKFKCLGGLIKYLSQAKLEVGKILQANFYRYCCSEKTPFILRKCFIDGNMIKTPFYFLEHHLCWKRSFYDWEIFDKITIPGNIIDKICKWKILHKHYATYNSSSLSGISKTEDVFSFLKCLTFL